MTTYDYRALCVELTDCLEKADWPLRHRYVFRQWIDIARAALADGPAVPEVVGSEWQPCVKLPITVHVREQRPGEQHVSTREGITPVQSDDLIMLGVDGEEYPIGRELFQRTYRMGSADEPAAVSGRPSDEELLATLDKATAAFPPRHPEAEGLNASEYLLALELRKARAVLARWGNPTPQPPEPGEVGVVVAWLRATGEGQPCLSDEGYARLTRAAELLERQALVPVSVSERLPGPEDCDSHGWCWVLYSAHSTWTLEPPYGQDGMPTGWTHWLPAHALPLPEVGD